LRRWDRWWVARVKSPPAGDFAFATGIFEIDERVFRFHFFGNLKLIWPTLPLGN
jgi:hypothetical protein